MLERSHSSPFEMWAACSAAKTKATNDCLYLPPLLCYHFLLILLQDGGNQNQCGTHKTVPREGVMMDAVCTVDEVSTCCVPCHNLSSMQHKLDTSMTDYFMIKLPLHFHPYRGLTIKIIWCLLEASVLQRKYQGIPHLIKINALLGTNRYWQIQLSPKIWFTEKNVVKALNYPVGGKVFPEEIVKPNFQCST